MKWTNFFKGIVIGGSNLIPGISGGTIALILGVYDELLGSIGRLFSKDWKGQLKFLIPIGLGMVIAVFLFASGVEWLFEYYPRPTLFTFIGLIIGVIPILLKESEAKTTFKWQHFLLLVVGVILVILLNTLQGNEELIIGERSFVIYGFLILAGFISGAAMILPGISGSLILLVVGAYGTVIHAVVEFQIDILIALAIGIGLGVIVISKVISYLLSQYKYATYAVIIGLVIGSIYVIFPGWPTGASEIVLSSVAFVLGLVVAYFLGRVEYKEEV